MVEPTSGLFSVYRKTPAVQGWVRSRSMGASAIHRCAAAVSIGVSVFGQVCGETIRVGTVAGRSTSAAIPVVTSGAA